jgi:hypothetical protein
MPLFFLAMNIRSIALILVVFLVANCFAQVTPSDSPSETPSISDSFSVGASQSETPSISESSSTGAGVSPSESPSISESSSTGAGVSPSESASVSESASLLITPSASVSVSSAGFTPSATASASGAGVSASASATRSNQPSFVPASATPSPGSVSPSQTNLPSSFASFSATRSSGITFVPASATRTPVQTFVSVSAGVSASNTPFQTFVPASPSNTPFGFSASRTPVSAVSRTPSTTWVELRVGEGSNAVSVGCPSNSNDVCVTLEFDNPDPNLIPVRFRYLNSFTNPNVNHARIVSNVIDLDLVDDNDDYNDLEICLRVSGNPRTSDTCLAYFDNSRNHWVCEDSSLNRDGNFLCGTTDRITNYAILELEDDQYDNDNNNNSASAGEVVSQSFGIVSLAILAVLVIQYLA